MTEPSKQDRVDALLGKLREHATPTNVVASLILVVGFLRLAFGSGDDDRFGETTLLYFFGAAAVFLLARAKSFKFGDLELELAQLKTEVASARLEAGIAEDAAKLELPATKPATLGLPAGEDIKPGSYHDDPWKGVFGGRNIDPNKGRMVTARVQALASQPGWYSVTLSVTRTDDASTPLAGPVQFFLHDTFHNDRPIIKAVNDQATLRLKAWGAFTVGVLTDDGACRLEIDLAELETAPMEFRLR